MREDRRRRRLADGQPWRAARPSVSLRRCPGTGSLPRTLSGPVPQHGGGGALAAGLAVRSSSRTRRGVSLRINF